MKRIEGFLLYGIVQSDYFNITTIQRFFVTAFLRMTDYRFGGYDACNVADSFDIKVKILLKVLTVSYS